MADIFATLAGFAYDVNGTGGWAQNGSTHSCSFFFLLFFNFQTLIFSKQDEKSNEKWPCVVK